MGEAKERARDARDAVLLIEMIAVKSMRLAVSESEDEKRQVQEQLENCRRELTDYFLQSDGRKGIYVQGEHR